jgi:hypothetical protein
LRRSASRWWGTRTIRTSGLRPREGTDQTCERRAAGGVTVAGGSASSRRLSRAARSRRTTRQLTRARREAARQMEVGGVAACGHGFSAAARKGKGCTSGHNARRKLALPGPVSRENAVVPTPRAAGESELSTSVGPEIRGHPSGRHGRRRSGGGRRTDGPAAWHGLGHEPSKEPAKAGELSVQGLIPAREQARSRRVPASAATARHGLGR